MKVYYDFHIHTALSPCGDRDMTPCNVVGMSMLKGLDVIAVTDHNSCGNVRAVMSASAKMGGPLVIPGMELETAENVHLVCLFESASAAETFADAIYPYLPMIENKVEIYGEQLRLDAEDEVVGEEKKLLVNATTLPLLQAIAIAKKFGAVVYPAHIDREANGILAIFGEVPESAHFHTVEFSTNAAKDLQKAYGTTYNITYGSDAHYLENISEREHALETPCLSIQDILHVIDRKKS